MAFIPAELAHPVVFNSLVLVASLYILFKSADLIVYGISDYAKKLGLSDAIIGLVVVATAASAPEIISSLTGFMTGQESVGFGAILGSNMVHAALGLGFLCTLGRKIKLEPNIFTKKRFLMWIALMLPFILILIDPILGIKPGLSRFDGIILLAAFGAYLYALWKLEGTFGKLKKQVQFKTIWRDVFIFLGAFAALLLAGRWLVFSAVQISNYYQIPAYFIALTVIGVGATIPDLAIELKSIFKKHASIGLGDLMGSLVIELLLFFGILALVKPLYVDLNQIFASLAFLAGSITLIMFWMNRKELTWKHGILLLGIYGVFIGLEIAKL